MLMLLCVHVTRVLFLVLAGNFALIWASTGVTRSYFSCPFLCALGCTHSLVPGDEALGAHAHADEDQSKETDNQALTSAITSLFTVTFHNLQDYLMMS